MANLFIGFPVPRAKIADMISSDAPALDHATQHESGGDDELDVTGLTGAGGVSFPIRGIWLDDYFVDDARWRTSFGGDSALTRSYDKLSFLSSDTNPSEAELELLISQPCTTLTWNKKRHLIFQCYLDCEDRTTAYIWIATGNPSGSNYVAFYVWDGKLWSQNRNSGGTAAQELLTFTGAFIGQDILLEAIHFPGDKIEYWVDGDLLHSETSRVPSGNTDGNYLAHLSVDNQANAYNVQIDFTNIQVYQEG